MSAPTRTQHATKRYIYSWGNGRAEGDGTMKDLLGGKGAGLAEMTNAGLPTPPGFTITTEACNDYFAAGKQLPAGLWDDVLEAVREVEAVSGKGFGDPANPLLVSVRSGAKFSMPGMMDTVLNLGLNEQTLQGLIALSGNERFGWDAYRRFIGMFGRIVMGVEAARFDEPLEARKHAHGPDAKDTDLTVDDLKALVAEFKAAVKADTGTDFPSDPYQQLDLAIKAVFASWFGKRANDYRNSQKIAHDLGTAVNVVTMVFGNMGDDSGTGVAFTRNTFDGTKELYGEYLVNAQGEDVVAGIRTPEDISHLKDEMPAAYEEFLKIGHQLEAHYRDVQDLEFTIERGKLYMLQTRIAKRTAAAAVKIAVQMVEEGVITEREAVARIEPAQVDQLLRAQFDPNARKGAQKVAKGLNASPGAAVGRAVFNADTAVEWVEKGEKVVLVRVETSPDDFHGMAVAQGILTARGGATSHAAVVARQIGKPCVAGCAELIVDYATKSAKSTLTEGTFGEGDWISVDGSTGEVFIGALPTVEARFEDQPELQKILGWADKIRRMQIWTNADKPEEAEQARGYGAQGIGLCRTEHMFREGERLEIVRGAILVANVATRAKAKVAAGEALSADESEALATFDAAMAKLEVLQQGDFEGILAAMSGLPVVVRLIDPPLHEFLPNLEEQLVKVTRAGDAATDEDKELLATIKSMHEQNPMLGLRGCRLGLIIPDFVKIQTRAILNAAVAVKKAGKDPRPEIDDPAGGPRERAHRHARPAGRGSGGRGGRRGRGDRLQVRHHDRDPAGRVGRGQDRRARRVLQLRHQRPDPDDVRLQPRRRRGRLPAQVRRGRGHPGRGQALPDPGREPLPDPRRRHRRRDADGRGQGPLGAPEPQGRHLRRARWRPRVDPQVRAHRPQLRLLLAVPRPRGAARGGTGGHGRRGRARQVASRGGRRRPPPT